MELAGLMKLNENEFRHSLSRSVMMRLCWYKFAFPKQSNFICKRKLKKETLLDTMYNWSSGAQSHRRKESNTVTAFRKRLK